MRALNGMNDRYEDTVRILLNSLERLNLEPRPIPYGRMDSLRGGASCLELSGRNVEVAILLTMARLQSQYGRDARALFKIDYASRGNIKGILPGRIVSKTVISLKGLLRKRIEGLNWETPYSRDEDSKSIDVWYNEGRPPGPGELWEGGPHNKLTDLLNWDGELMDSLQDFTNRGGGRFLLLHVSSDRWGESMRVGGSIWLRSKELMTTYVSPVYIEIVERILGHVKDVRESFGGLAY
jgi:hypothetical protein